MSGVGDSSSGGPKRHPFVIALQVVVAAEFVLLAVAVVYLVVETLSAKPDSYPSAVALIVLTAIAAIWLAFIVIGISRGRAWTRGAAIVWQVLQVAVAVGCFQGYFARPDLGWILLLPALVAIGLAVSPPVVRAIARRD